VERFLSVTLGGLSGGFVYAAVALSLVLIWRATRVLNFAQGAMAMFTAYLAYKVIEHGSSYWVALLVAMVSGLVMGALVERLLVRPVENGPPLNAVVVTLGVFIVVEGLAGMFFGGTPHRYPTHFSNVNYQLGDVSALAPFDIWVIVAVSVVAVLLGALFRYTDHGLRMRAAAFEGEVARMLGVRVGRMLTLGWALAAVIGALAAVLVSPNVPLSPTSMDAVFVFGFTGAVIGGLDSPVGAILGGVGIGLLLNYVAAYAGGDLQTLSALAVLVLVLMVRPSGLFSTTASRRV
jgi:branched-chain amino acid transport system permease protein